MKRKGSVEPQVDVSRRLDPMDVGIHTINLRFVSSKKHGHIDPIQMENGYLLSPRCAHKHIHVEFNPARVLDNHEWRAASIDDVHLATAAVWKQIRTSTRPLCGLKDTQLSRVDLCRDFQLPNGLPFMPRRTPNGRFSSYVSRSGQPQSVQALYANNLGSLKLYDKAAQLTYRPQKLEAAGVFRFEATLRRGRLKTLGLFTFSDLTDDSIVRSVEACWRISGWGRAVSTDPVTRLFDEHPDLGRPLVERLVAMQSALGTEPTFSARKLKEAFHDAGTGGEYRLDLVGGTLIATRCADRKQIAPRATCEAHGCGNNVHGEGLCNTHYKAMRRGQQQAKKSKDFGTDQ